MSYLTEEEQKMSNDDRILQLALGLQTCKIMKDAIELLVEAQELAVKDYKQKVREGWDKLMDKTDNLHNLECGDCDEAIEDFVKKTGL